MAITQLKAAALALGGAVAALGMAQSAQAADLPIETAVNGTSVVSLHLHPFLAADEIATLRLVASNPQALELFVKTNSGFSALAAAPEEGFIRNGKPVSSAVALADLPDMASARGEALKSCNSIKKTKTPCVIVLDVAPKR